VYTGNVVERTRERRWNLRVERDEDEIVRAASEVANTNRSSFIRDAAVTEAQRVLADRTHFSLDEDQWRQLMEALDRPPRVPPGLRDLFSRPSVFE
jgi:uncharacterized protein (DUF1778 family)